MNRGRLIVAGLALLTLLGVGRWLYAGTGTTEAAPYRVGMVERGDIESDVSATGTLNAERTVQVGTQVSGRVMEVSADFNDRVRKGQLLARIDPTLQQQAVRNAEASLDRSRAALTQAQREYDRNKALYEQKVITESEFSTVEYNFTVARSNVTSAQVQLDQARQNLAYTEIYAPIDGVVVERNVEPGQTVAASLSAPQLFLIANDLSQMEILASVDESDIGQIQPGQSVRFTVQAYPDDRFEGTVRQVRLQSTTAENVVNYTAVISVRNATGKLLPGMTASVDFMVQSATNVLKVPSAALRFRPTAEFVLKLGGDTTMLAPAGSGAPRTPDATTAPPNQAGQGGQNRQAGPAGQPPRAPSARIWYVKDGKLQVTRVQTGITDGSTTQISGGEVKEGMEVIVGLNTTTTTASATNPFQQQQQGGGGPGAGFGPPPGAR